MNHDYAHCLNYTDDCPKDCFRAELVRDALDKHLVMINWAHFKGTDECKKKEVNDHQRITDESKCCCSCKKNIRTQVDDVYVRCNCDKDGHYIGYVANFTCVCDEWEVTT